MSGIELSFDVEDRNLVPDNKLTFYKAEKDRIDVISFVYFRLIDDAVVRKAREKNPNATPEDLEKVRAKWLAAEAQKRGVPALSFVDRCGDFSSPKMNMYSVYSNDNLNGAKFFATRDPACNSDEDDALWNKVSDPQTKIVGVIIRYPVTPEGEVDVEQAQKRYKVMPWKFGPNTYKDLARLDNSAKKDDSRLGWKDVQIKCKDSTYQNISPSLFGKATWRSFPPELQEKILREAYKIGTSPMALPAKMMTTAELKTKMGIRETPTTSFTAPSSGEEEGDDILNML